jgi:RIO kinase 2
VYFTVIPKVHLVAHNKSFENMILQAIRVFKQLQSDDFALLATIERWMRRYEFVPTDRLQASSKLSPKDTLYSLGRLNKFKLVTRRTGDRVSYKLLPAGSDALALKSLVDNGVLEAFGTPLGIGKEADIYDALAPDGTKVAVKFNRLGRTSFTRARSLRPYSLKHDWMYISRRAASREFEALQKLYPTVSVPRPIALDRHVVVMDLIDGTELTNARKISEAKNVLNEIIENIKRTYQLGIVHADLSEHNIVIKPNRDILIIDWPQYLPAHQANADEMLERDIENVLKYFKRKFGVASDASQVLKYIIAG